MVFFCLSNNRMFSKIGFTYVISYIATICSLTTYNQIFSILIIRIGVSSLPVTSINRVSPFVFYIFGLNGFTCMKFRQKIAKFVFLHIHNISS